VKIENRVKAICLSLSLAGSAFAAQGDPVGGYKLLTTISIPGGLTGNDISWVDSATGRFYLADRGNATASPAIPPRVDVIDTEHLQFVMSIPLPSASNGIVGIPRAHEVWVGLNDSTINVINTDTNTITHVISTGGKARADEVAYDPLDHLILIANDRDTPPFVTFVSTVTYSVVQRINYDGTSAPQSTGGIEQPVWDAQAGKFYISIPSTKTNANGEVDEIDPLSLSLTRSFPTTCGPAGLALLPGQRLITSCGDVVDVLSGKVVTTVPGVGGDEIWYNPGDQRVYFAGGTDRISVNVIDGNTYAKLPSLTVGQILTAPAVSQTTHSIAADAEANVVLVPVTAVGVQVWRNGASLSAFPNPAPVTGTADGTMTVIWNAPNAQLVEIHIGSATGPLFATGGNRGAAPTGPWVSDGMTFYLQDVSSGSPSTANTIATLVVHLQKM
jgi:hypothetical protein